LALNRKNQVTLKLTTTKRRSINSLSPSHLIEKAGTAELADAADSKDSASIPVALGLVAFSLHFQRLNAHLQEVPGQEL
jgi:hypothetical protein